jgi:ATPase family protein associated with various cellular activities (AAA)
LVSRAMKKSLDAISPYYEVSNIRDARQLKVFTVQLQRYFREQAQELDRWIKSKDGALVASLAILEDSLYDRFGITSQALRHFAEYARKQNWERSKTAVIGHAIELMQSEALDGRLDVNCLALKRLWQVDTNAGHFLNVSMDPAARLLRPFDLTGWERILHGPYECARLTNGKSMERSEVPTSVITLTASQRELLAPLQAHWRIKQRGERIAGYDPRPNPLIVAPSGSGKTALVRHFAAVEKMPMKDFNIGTWIVTGAKAEPPTLNEIGDFIRDNTRGVLFFDELDKLCGATDWTRCIQQEIYALLDGRTDSFPYWDEKMAKKLARDFFIVGAGTGQRHYARRDLALGFGATDTDDRWAIELNKQDQLPGELLMRFNAEVLFLHPPTKTEFGEHNQDPR